jgi:hypothetical protein
MLQSQRKSKKVKVPTKHHLNRKNPDTTTGVVVTQQVIDYAKVVEQNKQLVAKLDAAKKVNTQKAKALKQEVEAAISKRVQAHIFMAGCNWSSLSKQFTSTELRIGLRSYKKDNKVDAGKKLPEVIQLLRKEARVAMRMIYCGK